VANTYTEQAQGTETARLKAWVLGLMLSAVLMLAGGIVLAAFVDGPAQLWTGLAYVVAMGLALVVGLSKTSSA
jgi:hypothetical protein